MTNFSKKDSPEYAVLLSTMRSGSTLVKALIGSAPDIAHLPETNFRKILSSRAEREALEAAHPERILLLKRPAWFHETRSYPVVPENLPCRRVLLIRDVYETVRSVGRMLGGKTFDRFPGLWGQKWIARRYWAPVTRNLLEHYRLRPEDSLLIRYEDVLSAPEEKTLRIFRFLGSEQWEGIRSYESPENFRWKWGSDDGSPRIKSRTVLPPRELGEKDQQRKQLIAGLPEIQKIREAAGFGGSPARK